MEAVNNTDGQVRVTIFRTQSSVSPVKLEKVDVRGNTPLVHAILNRAPSVGLALIHEGAHLNIQDARGHKPPRSLIKQGDSEPFLALVERGIDINIGDSEGNTALHLLPRSFRWDLDPEIINKIHQLEIDRRRYKRPMRNMELIGGRWRRSEHN